MDEKTMIKLSAEYYIVRHAPNLCLSNRKKLYLYIKGLNMNIIDCADGGRVNLSKGTAFHIDSIYGKLLQLQEYENSNEHRI